MRHLFPAFCIVMLMSLPCFAQCGVNEGSYDYEFTLNERKRERERAKRLKAQKGTTFEDAIRSSEISYTYPTHTMDRAIGFSEGLAIVRVKGKAGYIDESGRIVISAKFLDAKPFCDGLAAVEVNGKWGFINKKGQIVVPAEFDWALSFSEGLAAVIVGKKWGYIDGKGKMIVKPQFDEVNSFSENVAAVCEYQKDYQWKFIDRKGKYKCGFIDKEGKWFLQPIYDAPIKNFDGGMAFVTRDIGYKNGVVVESYFVDKTGRELWVNNSWYITEFSDNLLVVADKDRNYGYVDRNGKPAFEAKFKQVNSFSEGLAAVQIDGKYGFINKQGQLVIDGKFDWAGGFSEGLANVADDNNKWGFIDKSGKIIIELQFDWAWSFNNGIAPVAVGEKVGYIDRTGNYIWKPTK